MNTINWKTILWEYIKTIRYHYDIFVPDYPYLKIVGLGVVLTIQNTGHTATCNCGLTKSTLMLVANHAGILYNTH